MREKADEDGVDLLLVDTGDRIEGNGLYDASEPKGEYTTEIFKEQGIDVICSGNHELYKRNSSENEYTKTVPNFRDTYLASNIDIFDPVTGERVPLAPRYRKFTTKNQGIRILAFGFLYDFTGNYNNTIVQPVEQTIEETWFQDAIRDREVDLFLVTGHVAVRSREYLAIFKAIREQQWDTPIQFFGGHTHIRDYVKYDSKSYALESGRYLETVGFMSIDGFGTGGKGQLQPRTLVSPKFERRYIDNNLFSFHHHTGLNSTTFPTKHGTNVTRMITDARKELKLDSVFGCAPYDLWTNRVPYPSQQSIFTWLENEVLPNITTANSSSGEAKLVLINTGAMRFDIFKGAFTRDTTFIVSPFTSGFRQIQNVPYEFADKLLRLLNNEGQILSQTPPQLQASDLAPPEQMSILEDIVFSDEGYHQDSSQTALRTPNLSPGYTTKDDAGEEGDDTIHSPISFYRVPNCIQSKVDFPDSRADPEKVHLVFLEFIQPWVLTALKLLGLEFGIADTEAFMEGHDFTTMIAQWVEQNWKGNC